MKQNLEIDGLFQTLLDVEVSLHLSNRFCIEIEYNFKVSLINSGVSLSIPALAEELEKLSGNTLFRQKLEGQEIPMEGHPFTWGNNRLDHHLLVLKTGSPQPFKKKLFSFDKRWLKQPGVREEVPKVWNLPVQGNWYQWKLLKQQLDEAYKRKFNAITRLVKDDHTFCESKEELTDCLADFYHHLFTSEGSTDEGHLLDFIPSTITADHNRNLVAKVTEDEDGMVRIQMALKLDMTKAFDQIEWSSIRKIMDKMVLIAFSLTGHLFFADDSLLFCQASVESALLILDMLSKYKICSTLNGISRHTSSKYLGLPLGIGKSKKQTFSYVVEAVKGRLCNWKKHFLSGAGKEVLVKSVLCALPVLTMSCFFLSVGICKELSQLFSHFWWKFTGSSSSGIHWKAWHLLTLPKAAGALILKQIWRCYNGILPVAEILIKRGVKVDPIYMACGEKLETAEKVRNLWIFQKIWIPEQLIVEKAGLAAVSLALSHAGFLRFFVSRLHLLSSEP
ncbi:RNA-directed DNA polymerase (reversetranscriptase)-related family protein [Striga asiatica]|uniref:RNA-directed DNA polymerase (Reversetranscriptase)-related family protein n=1 Tax=Striga asiatica TaxID=4170 RepID=A0A5A7Q3E7_STRAF|nr:RNA-directed DNA polymerase (reversetranscriptase)-related family protein [Striga asiatica]